MSKNNRQRILLIFLGIWTAALLVYTGWSLADYFLQRSNPTATLSTSFVVPFVSPTAFLSATRTSSAPGVSSTSLTTPTNLPGSIPTSTPLPTLPPGTPASPTPTRYKAPTQPPSYYFGLMTQLYAAMIGQWRGMVSITVNRQSRPTQLITLEFYALCQTGQACGKYHWETGCFGDLVLMKWRPKTLVFRNVEYSGNESCKDWVEYAVQPKPGDTLYLSMSFRDKDRRRISKGVTLRRR